MNLIQEDTDLDSIKKILQNQIRSIDIRDIQNLSIKFNKETRHIPPKYQKQYNEDLLKVIIQRYQKLKNDKKTYNRKCQKSDVEIIDKLLEKKEDKIEYLMNITAIYAIYFLREPVHPNNMLLPGNLKIYKEDKIYYCPIKRYHMNDNEALCKYCIAKIPGEGE